LTGIWLTSDLHLGHRLVANHRGFGEDTDAHDHEVCLRWARTVQPDDQVWVLGDLCLTNPERALDLVRNLPGRKHFIAGNHDAVHPMHRHSHRYQREWMRVFDSVQPFGRLRVDGQDVLLSHFPYSKDRHEARYMQYRLRDEGAWLLHGHTHGKERREGREIHVGLDAWDLAPVNLGTIVDLMRDDTQQER
jgi:calcineurin-like phosphoesterase family protein